jgi:putative aldouronate transport system permease protein
MIENTAAKHRIKRSKPDLIFDIINYSLLTLFTLIILYPLYFVIIASFSNPDAIYEGRIYLIPKEITFEGYKKIFEDAAIWTGYANTIKYAVVGTTVNVVLTITGAYPLSRKDLYGRNIFMYIITFTMFFGGGLIPTYLLVKNLGMLDTMWALIMPGAISVWNLIIARTFFQTTIPEELREAAEIDGCSDIIFFTRIVIPLSKALIAIQVLFYAIGHWNAFFSALIYLKDRGKYPLQLILRNILIMNEAAENSVMDQNSVAEKQRVADLIKYGAIIVSSIPVLILYPFIQKYFVKGVMIGSIKG